MPVRVRAVFGVLLLLGLFSTRPAQAQVTPPQLIQLNPFLTQQARFTNVQYNIYPSGLDLAVPLIETGNIMAGPLAVHPHFGIAQSYTDNVFRTDTTFGGRRPDWYQTLAPGLQLQLPFLSRYKLVADYRSNLERYNRDSSQDVDDYTFATNLIAEYPGGLSVKLLEELRNGHDYRGAATATGVAEPNKFFNTSYGGEVQLASQTFVRARFKSIRWEFIGPNAGPRDGTSFGDINTRNRLEHYASLAVGGRVAPKSYVFLEGWTSRQLYEINKDLDSTVYVMSLGSTWEATGKTTGNFAMGWQGRHMDRPSAGTRGSGTFSSLYFNGYVTWKPQEQTQVNWGIYRRTNETVLGGTRYFISTGTTLDVGHSFTEKWRGTLQLVYDHDTYSDPITAEGKTAQRKDNYVTLGAGLWYQIQPWLGTRATYTYGERLSVFNSVQYVSSVIMLSAQAQF